MSDFEAYMLAQARCEKATATYNWAAVHGKEYAAAIELIESHAKLWAPEEG